MIYEKVREELKDAMKNKDVDRRDVLKMVINKAKEIVKKSNPHDQCENISDDDMLKAIQKEIKQLNQTKDALKGMENTDLYSKTANEITILSAYLPQLMSENEVEEAVKSILSIGNYSNFGAKMKAVMSELKGKADNKIIKEVVERYKD